MGSGAFLVETCRQLGDELVKAWHVHNCAPKLPPDEDEVLHARRLIAQRCLYGVDKNPMAVDLAKLSLWLATLAKDHPFTFLDHSLRCGDSLVGLSREQIAAFHWEDVSGPSSVVSGKKGRRHATDRGPRTTDNKPMFGDPIAERMRTVTEYRQRILASRDDKPYEQLRQELDVADEALSLARLAGDAVIATYFSAGKDRERVAKLDTLARQLVQYLGPQRRIEDRQPLAEAVASLHSGDHPLQPFHWQIEFPEVFTVDAKGKPTGGFDAIVGNPPFLGGKRISGSLGKIHSEWICGVHPESNGNADLVAHFFRRAYGLLRDRGCFGLIATNTIAQGDTRRSGLRWIGNHGGTIFDATRRLRWPGEAAVVVSVVQVAKTSDALECTLDRNNVRFISAFLFAGGTHDDPRVLSANKNNVFVGCDIKGQGFLFDDDDAGASPTSLMEECLRQDPRNSECIRPYLGGAELNDSPTQRHSRWVIFFGDMSEDESSRWPILFKIVQERVRPDRLRMSDELAAWPWWKFWRVRNELYARAAGLRKVTVCAQTSRTLAFSLLSPSTIFSHKTIVVTWLTHLGFCVLQSHVHQHWAYFFGSTLKDDPVYTPSDCFETYPFPQGVLASACGDGPSEEVRAAFPHEVRFHLDAMENAGREYYEFRAALMVRNNEGLTKTYNRFHDPHETSPDILKLRELHAVMDRAVLDAYGWHDLAEAATCEFLLDYEDEEDDEQLPDHGPRTSRRKKPWRYRWPDEFRDEVLARLLALNKERAEQERLAGKAAEAAEGKESGRKRLTGGRKSSKRNAAQRDLPGV